MAFTKNSVSSASPCFTTAMWAGNSPVSGCFRKKNYQPSPDEPAFQLRSWGSGRRCSPTLECHCRWSLECPRPVTDVTSGLSGKVIGWGPIMFQRQQREVASEMTLMHLISSMIHLRIYVYVCRDKIKHTQPHSYQKHIGQLQLSLDLLVHIAQLECVTLQPRCRAVPVFLLHQFSHFIRTTMGAISTNDEVCAWELAIPCHYSTYQYNWVITCYNPTY